MKETYKDYFHASTAARRYARGRPRFHAFAVERIARFLEIEKPLGRALDVGCGTGLSTRALRAIAERAAGVDLSVEMLAQAERTENVEYAAASAERLPFGAGVFDLITISQAIHWLDREKFFDEAGRVLKPGAPVVAYDNYFQGRMTGEPRFEQWYRGEFLVDFPVPPRGRREFARTSERAADFVLFHEEFNANALEFTARSLVDYLVTITNVIARVENGGASIDEVYERILTGIEPFFGGRPKMLEFVGPIWFLRANH
ncbi:MAG: class I SAM-dependent methyltransferase [Acidobacteria bacterium]|nr:class I SAM-dependent methyltransferase [Acidobacteriota bacterium]